MQNILRLISNLTFRNMSKFAEIQINQGKLRGTIEKDIYGKEYFSFQGIPYAKPPIKNLRFKAPQPPEPWGDVVYNACSGKCNCPTIFESSKIPSSEDCLYLNVYTPSNVLQNVPQKLPVIVHIHGGGFFSGSGHKIGKGPDFFVGKDIVLVTFNYRVGILGFLQLNHPDIPGNAGMKDMVQALRWVQENITHFGGDRNNVTICGGSAGGVAVHLLMYSPMAQNLFHKAIMQSGTAFSPWVRTTRDDEQFANIVGYDCRKTKCSIDEFLINLPIEKIMEGQKQYQKLLGTALIIPVIEIIGENKFLSESVDSILAKDDFKSVPLIIGHVKTDGTAISMFPKFRNNKHNIADTTLLVPNWYKQTIMDKDKLSKMNMELKKLYFKNKEIDLVEWFTDVEFILGSRKMAVEHSKKAPVYYYVFDLISNLNRNSGRLVHGDDNRYLYSKPETQQLCEPGTVEEKYATLMTTMWANFAKTGNPNPIPFYPDLMWANVTDTELNYLNISEPFDVCSNFSNSERLNQMEKILNGGT